MTNSVGILILMLLSVTAVPNVPPGITWEMMRQAQARCADLESHQNELQKQWEELKADKEQKQAELEKLQAQLEELHRLAGIPHGDLAECVSLGSVALKSLLQTAGSKQGQMAEMQNAIMGLHDRLSDLQTAIQDKRNVTVLESTISGLQARIDRLKREKEELQAKITQVDLEQAAIKELQGKLEDLNKEIEGLNASIEQLKAQVQHLPDPNGLGGSYTGPYVLLECDGQGAVVHPDGRRIPPQPSQADLDWLSAQVKAVGAVALLSHPSGFDESFGKFYEILTTLAREQKDRGQTIVLILWPIEQDEKIEKYLRKKNETK
jgi:peptidoglycan hydrolase CwlO-like protein